MIILLISSSLFGNIAQLCYEDSIALTISTMAKNNAIALALATSAFGAENSISHCYCRPIGSTSYYAI
ncbi:MAG: hypothetical protein AB1422_07040 [bacterium]